MRYWVIGAVIGLAVGGYAGAETPDPALMAPIQKFVDSFNAGDVAGAAATHAATADLAIIDEVPPHLWRGAQAFQAWAADLDGYAQKNGITDQGVTISTPIRQETSGDLACVVVPAVYAFKQGGVSMREAAHMTLVLKKGADGWLIHGWTWTGPKPERAP
jgi:ketosteroid isomerase-like protein